MFCYKKGYLNNIYNSNESCDKLLAANINPFSTLVPLTDNPGSWFLLAKCLKNARGRVTF